MKGNRCCIINEYATWLNRFITNGVNELEFHNYGEWRNTESMEKYVWAFW